MAKFLQNGKILAKWQNPGKTAKLRQNGKIVLKIDKFDKLEKLWQNGRIPTERQNCIKMDRQSFPSRYCFNPLCVRLFSKTYCYCEKEMILSTTCQVYIMNATRTAYAPIIIIDIVIINS